MDKEIKDVIGDIWTKEVEVSNVKNIILDSQIPKGLKVINLKCAVLCVDIRSSTNLSNKIGIKNMTKIYHVFSKIAAKSVYLNNGKIIQFAGDGFLAAFADEHSINGSTKAYQTVIRMQELLKETYQKVVKSEYYFDCGYGIAYGHIYMTRTKDKKYKLQSFGIFPGRATNFSSKLCDKAEKNMLFFDRESYKQSKPKKCMNCSLYGEEVYKCEV